MSRRPVIPSLAVLLSVLLGGCGGRVAREVLAARPRPDGATRVLLSISGSLQNPAWSPDGASLLFTRFLKGYNADGPAQLKIVRLADAHLTTLVADGSANINLPGSSWNKRTHRIVFASTRDPHDEIYLIADGGPPGSERRITARAKQVAYEPSFSPDGRQVVFESHPLDVAGRGVIMKHPASAGGAYQALTAAALDCRQPNWSPQGGLIVYQRRIAGRWDLWVMKADGSGKRQVTGGAGNKTDASFSPDGKWLVYSFEMPGTSYANLFAIPVAGGSPVRVTRSAGYDGAPSWSPDGKRIAFESCQGDPDGSAGTSLWLIEAPPLP